MANNTKDPSEIMKINDLFRTCNMYENIEPLSDEVKIFQCEDADETSSINSALSAMSLRSIANSRRNENVPVNEDIFQKVKRVQQMAALRKECKDNEQESAAVKTRIARHDDEDDEEYDEEKGAQLLEKMIASVLKPKSRQKEAFMQNINFKPDIVISTTEKKSRYHQYDK